MEETKNKKKVNKTINKNKKKTYINRRILAVSILVLFIALVITLIMLLKPEKELDFVDALLANNYYLKLVEVDKEFKEQGNVITITRDEKDLVIEENNQRIIIKDDAYIQIFHDKKIISEYSRQSNMNNINIGAALDKKELISQKEEILNNSKYICKTYSGDIKLYFDGENIKYISTMTGVIKVLEFEGKTREELFELPEIHSKK